MGTETKPKSSNSSEIPPLAEFDSDNEPVAELDEGDVIEPLKKTTDDTGDPEQENEPDTPGEMGADTDAREQEIPLNEPGGQVESDAEEGTDDTGDESEIHLDKTDGEADEPDSDADADDSSSDEEEQATANDNKNEFAGLDDDEIDDGIDSRPENEAEPAGGDQKQGKPGEGPVPQKAATIKDPGIVKKLDNEAPRRKRAGYLVLT